MLLVPAVLATNNNGGAGGQPAEMISTAASVEGCTSSTDAAKNIPPPLLRTSTSKDSSSDGKETTLVYPASSFTTQLRALLWKRYLNAKREPKTTFVQQTCPCTLVTVSMLFLILSFKDLPYLSLDYELHYDDKPYTPYTIAPEPPDMLPDSPATKTRYSEFVRVWERRQGDLLLGDPPNTNQTQTK